jgi:hypothetical protein
MALALRLTKLNQLFIASDEISKVELLELQDGEYSCKVAKPKRKQGTEEQRRAAQNRLSWMWYTDMEKTRVEAMAGNTKEEWYRMMKDECLYGIYVRDDINGFNQTEELLLKQEAATYLKIRDSLVDLMSTSALNVEQFSEYLHSIELFAHKHGITLRTDPQIFQLLGKSDGIPETR